MGGCWSGDRSELRWGRRRRFPVMPRKTDSMYSSFVLDEVPVGLVKDTFWYSHGLHKWGLTRTDLERLFEINDFAEFLRQLKSKVPSIQAIRFTRHYVIVEHGSVENDYSFEHDISDCIREFCQCHYIYNAIKVVFTETP
jgi:hypothetical protein